MKILPLRVGSRVILYKLIDVSEERTVSIFIVVEPSQEPTEAGGKYIS
jgi:hypothetical protein